MSTNKVAVALAAAALVVAALGATPVGHAAAQLILPKGSVGTPQLKAGAVTGLKVKDGSLAAVDFKAGELPAGAKGEKGEKGDPGPQGPKGDPGAPGTSGYQYVTGAQVNLSPAEAGTAVAKCPAGKRALGGGYSAGAWTIRLGSMGVSGNLDAWLVTVRNEGGVTTGVLAYVVCANVGQ